MDGKTIQDKVSLKGDKIVIVSSAGWNYDTEKFVQLDNDPGFSMNNEIEIRFHTFPHKVYSSPVRYTVFNSSQ